MTDTQSRTTVSTWTIDPSHSHVEFAVKHMMFTTVRGSFERLSGTIRLDEANVANSSVEVEIEAASISTRDEKRDAHLRSADFFDVERYPTITFRSTRVEPVGENRLKVTGDLTMHGVTREVVLDTEFTGRGKSPFGFEVLGYTATTTINRDEFGLTWNAALETGGVLVGNEIKITIDVEAIPAESQG